MCCFPGWIDQQDLPAVYALSELLLYPSNMEAFPIPHDRGDGMWQGDRHLGGRMGFREIAADAALLVDPSDPDAVAGRGAAGDHG